MREANTWMKEIKRKFDTDKLQKEAGAINALITVDKFVRFLKNKNPLSGRLVVVIWVITRYAQLMMIFPRSL